MRRVEYNSKISYPSTPTKRGSSFNGWDKEVNTMPAEDVTVTAQWKVNQYNLTFVFNNGAENEVGTLNYNSPIEYPRNVAKDGYTFDG